MVRIRSISASKGDSTTTVNLQKAKKLVKSALNSKPPLLVVDEKTRRRIQEQNQIDSMRQDDELAFFQPVGGG